MRTFETKRALLQIRQSSVAESPKVNREFNGVQFPHNTCAGSGFKNPPLTYNLDGFVQRMFALLKRTPKGVS